METHSGSTSSWDYLDFELEVRVGGPREYPVTVRSPAGEAQGQMRFPFDEWELKDRLQSLEIALLRSGGMRRRIPSPEEHTVQDFGRGLFESLLVGDVRTRYEMSLSEARRQGKGLRLKLRIQPSELAVLPWEFLYDAERDRYPSLSSNTPLVRYLDLPQPVEPLPVSPPLRVLGMVTSPLGLDPLDVEHEKRLVEEAIRGLREGGLLELTWLEGQTWRHLQRAMRRGPWHVFHFVGHGGFDAATEEGALALSNDAGHMDLLRATGLAELLDDHYPLRLVFLNSCEGARGSESDAFSSTAATLVRRGVPAVVAMQYEITDRAAIEFSRSFYEALADSLPVDAAVTEARAAVSMDSMLEWGTPVLYMHSPDGRVFDVLASSPRAHPTPEREERREEDRLRRYREGVESAWANEKLESNDVQWLRDLANNQLSLRPTTAADIEREIMGDTKEAILERLERAATEQEHRKRLEALYAQARRSYSNQEWQATLDLFEKIYAEDPTYPDPEGLLASTREALEVEERTQRVATLYEQGQRHIKAEEWQQALECFEEIQRLEPNYRETKALLEQTRQEVSAEHAEKAEAGEQSREQRAGQSTDQAERVQPDYSTGTEPQPLLSILGKNWWALASAGLINVIHGVLASFVTFEPLSAVLLLASLTIATGVFLIIASNTSHPVLLLRIQGMISVLAGLVIALSDLTGFRVVDGFTSVFVVICLGIIQMIVAIRLWHASKVMWLLLVSGALLVVSGIHLLYLMYIGLALDQGSWVYETPRLLGIWGLASGISLVAFAFRVRHLEVSEAEG
jgi:tetratricopeptide (TPR) repeat protein